jgi:hypothetical protein
MPRDQQLICRRSILWREANLEQPRRQVQLPAQPLLQIRGIGDCISHFFSRPFVVNPKHIGAADIDRIDNQVTILLLSRNRDREFVALTR